jgi:hypothetical protein
VPITLIRMQEVTIALVAEVGKVMIDGEKTRFLIRNQNSVVETTTFR